MTRARTRAATNAGGLTTQQRVLRWFANYQIDGVTLLVLPAIACMLLLFIYPFLYGLVLSLRPRSGEMLDNYRTFFSDPFLYDTIWTTMRLALPATIVNVGMSVPIALLVRSFSRQRLITAILVVPITLGPVLIAEGMLNYWGPQGWFNSAIMALGISSAPIRLVHNYTGVLISLVVAGFPFVFLLTLSFLSGLDPSLEKAASTLGAGPRARFRHILLPLLLPALAVNFCMSFVQMFSVFPAAVLLGEPAGATRVISIAAYQAAYEQYNASMASTIAMIMGAVQLAIVAIVLGSRELFYRGATGSGKG